MELMTYTRTFERLQEAIALRITETRYKRSPFIALLFASAQLFELTEFDDKAFSDTDFARFVSTLTGITRAFQSAHAQTHERANTVIYREVRGNSEDTIISVNSFGSFATPLKEPSMGIRLRSDELISSFLPTIISTNGRIFIILLFYFA